MSIVKTLPPIYLEDYSEESSESALQLKLEVEHNGNAAWFNIYLSTGEKITSVGVDYFGNGLRAFIDHLDNDEADVFPILDDVENYQPLKEN